MLLTWAILLTILCALCIALTLGAAAGDSFALSAFFVFLANLLGYAAGVFWLLYIGVNVLEYLAAQGYIG